MLFCICIHFLCLRHFSFNWNESQQNVCGMYWLWTNLLTTVWRQIFKFCVLHGALGWTLNSKEQTRITEHRGTLWERKRLHLIQSVKFVKQVEWWPYQGTTNSLTQNILHFHSHIIHTLWQQMELTKNQKSYDSKNFVFLSELIILNSIPTEWFLLNLAKSAAFLRIWQSKSDGASFTIKITQTPTLI